MRLRAWVGRDALRALAKGKPAELRARKAGARNIATKKKAAVKKSGAR